MCFAHAKIKIMIYGYARVSTLEQNIDLQVEALRKAGCEKVYLEKASGGNRERIELKLLMGVLRAGDELIVLKLDRLARDSRDLNFLLEELADLKIVLRVGDLVLDFSRPEGRLIARVFGAIAEFERSLIRERTMAGLKYARSKGRVGGKPKGIGEAGILKAKLALELREKGLTVEQILKAAEIKSKRTLYKYLRIAARLKSEETGLPLSENGIDLIDSKE